MKTLRRNDDVSKVHVKRFQFPETNTRRYFQCSYKSLMDKDDSNVEIVCDDMRRDATSVYKNICYDNGTYEI